VSIQAEQWSKKGGLAVATLTQRSLQTWVDQREGLLLKSLTEAQKAVRHKCFVSYHHADDEEVKTFIETFENAFIPRVLGVSDEDDFIKSDDTGYIMDQIREKYLTDSTVTIVLNGKCTWARRYIDWEVYSTLRNDALNRRSGLMAIELLSLAPGSDGKLPPRVNDNVDSNNKKYARYWKYPSSVSSLQGLIEQAFQARTTKASVIDNSRERKINNSQCP
jgi:hypothetical protein